MKIDGDYAIFDSGKKVSAHRGIIGLDPWMQTYEGFDNVFPAWPDEWRDDSLNEGERQELADFMIALWTEFKSAKGIKPEEWA